MSADNKDVSDLTQYISKSENSDVRVYQMGEDLVVRITRNRGYIIQNGYQPLTDAVKEDRRYKKIQKIKELMPNSNGDYIIITDVNDMIIGYIKQLIRKKRRKRNQ